MLNEEYSVACQTDADCPHPDLGQKCTRVLIEDGSSYANGQACFNGAIQVCPERDAFGRINVNYENGGFISYIQFECTTELASDHETTDSVKETTASDDDATDTLNELM